MKRSLLLVAFWIILFLNSCVDLDLSMEADYSSTPYNWGFARADCDDAWGGNFHTEVTNLLGSLYIMTFIDIASGINPLAFPYQCKIFGGSGYECCGCVTIDAEDLFKTIPVTLVCGTLNPCIWDCGDPY